MKLLITGGAGCLGANIIDAYLERPGMEILVLDNFATGYRASLPQNAENLEIIEGSVSDEALVNRVFDGFKPTHVIHSAAAYKDPDDWVEDARTNVLGSIYVARASERVGVKRLVNFQTSLTFGRPETTPIPNDAPSKPFTSYGVSKTAGEQVMLAANLNVVSLRLSNITGPRLSIGPIPTFYTRLKAGKGCFCSDTYRDFMDMSDFMAFLELALDADAPQGVFNVGTGESKSINDVFDQAVAYLGITMDEPVPVVPAGADDVQTVVLDASETEKAFNWKAKVSFEDTIRKMYQWYDEFGVTAIFSHVKAPDVEKK
ncbi:MAG: NAD-dependent epimerase/dehydratase family protein [Robiginitomaculum sp.]|nr:NAD-dependent epimerase/dehydratase family protein [Robiginitomaculum sp.]